MSCYCSCGDSVTLSGAGSKAQKAHVLSKIKKHFAKRIPGPLEVCQILAKGCQFSNDLGFNWHPLDDATFGKGQFLIRRYVIP